MSGEQTRIIIDEAYLYAHMPQAERLLMSLMPSEEELNHKFSGRFERKMKALIKYERQTPWERRFYRGMKLALATVAVILLVAFGSAMSVKASRFRIIEFFVEVYEELTSYSVKDAKPEGESMIPVEPDYIPAGYEEIDRRGNDTEFHVVYGNVQGGRIYYNQAAASAGIRLWDTEESIVEDIKIGGVKVCVVEDVDGMYTVYWQDEEYVYSLVDVKNADIEELIKMARNVIKKVE